MSGPIKPRLRRHPNAEALYQAITAAFVSAANRAIRERGRFDVALAGGNTPGELYRRLAELPAEQAIDWPRVHIWFGDERCVPPDSERSNYRMATTALLAHVTIAPGHIHRMRGEDEPRQAAAHYEQELIHAFGAAALPSLDLILLGIGADGHTASLFPGTPALSETRQRVYAQYVADQKEWRITLTFPALNAARTIWLLVSGPDKADIVARALGATENPPLPVQQLAPTEGNLEWWLDEAAACGVDKAD